MVATMFKVRMISNNSQTIEETNILYAHPLPWAAILFSCPRRVTNISMSRPVPAGPTCVSRCGPSTRLTGRFYLDCLLHLYPLPGKSTTFITLVDLEMIELSEISEGFEILGSCLSLPRNSCSKGFSSRSNALPHGKVTNLQLLSNFSVALLTS
jgi:hypothetical protein